MSNETEKKLGQLQLLEQGLQNFAAQKQQFQSQFIEIESALAELEKTEKAYKIVGNIMIAAKKEELKEELKKRKEMFEIRIKTIEKQEDKMKEKASRMQSEILGEMKGEE